MKLYLTKGVALGNGTRTRGHVLGEVSDDADLPALCDAAWRARQVSELPSKVFLADGVEDGELLTALRSHLVETDIEPEPVSSTNDWRQTAVTAIGLDKSLAEALSVSGLQTVGDLYDFGAEHEGEFTLIEGVGGGRQKAIISALEVVVPKELQ